MIGFRGEWVIGIAENPQCGQREGGAEGKVAAILSVVESCRPLGISVKEYLGEVLPGIDRRKVSEFEQSVAMFSYRLSVAE